MDKRTIELTGMAFHAFHGCLQEEKEAGNLFIVDFSCSYDFSKAEESDALDDTLDYSGIYDIVSKEMETASNLLEHVTGRIVRAIAAAYPEIPEFTVKVAKQSPPVSGPAAWSSVTITHCSE